MDIFAFNICGAYLFYLIWEVDHAYSVPFMLMLLMWAADEMTLLADKMTQMQQKVPTLRFLPWMAVAGQGLVFLGILLAVRRAGLPVRV